MSRQIIGILAAIILGGSLVACAKEPPKPGPNATLYERLGGKPAIEAVVDDFLGNVAANPEINFFFANSDIGKLRGHLVAQVCEASGGPCKYTGRDMPTTHKGMAITERQFNSMGADMQKTLVKFHVPDREQKELLTLLGSLQKDIVGK
ncbi:MAG: group 1 truncated hemoglobin [Alphaproteobacteria bacterium]|nr:group 1 truncated hemoglobin [Alphaproteobacteria bacterium]